MTLLTLERKLRNGETPESMGLKPIGGGVQKTAYIVHCDIRDYIVKRNTGGFRVVDYKGNPKRICPNLQKYGIIRVIQKIVGEWLIQEATTPLLDSKDKMAWELYDKFDRIRRDDGIEGDFHAGNFGVTKNGRLVCFDW